MLEDIDTARLRPGLRDRARAGLRRTCLVCGRPSQEARCPEHRSEEEEPVNRRISEQT